MKFGLFTMKFWRELSRTRIVSIANELNSEFLLFEKNSRVYSPRLSRSAKRNENAGRLPPSGNNSGVYLQQGGGRAESRGSCAICTHGVTTSTIAVNPRDGWCMIDIWRVRSDNRSPSSRRLRWSRCLSGMRATRLIMYKKKKSRHTPVCGQKCRLSDAGERLSINKRYGGSFARGSLSWQEREIENARPGLSRKNFRSRLLRKKKKKEKLLSSVSRTDISTGTTFTSPVT